MEGLVVAIDPKMPTIYFLFYAVFAITISTIIYFLMRRPSARREQFRNGIVFSQIVSLFVALAVAIPILVYSYRDSWSYFYNVKKNDSMLIIEYFFPRESMQVEITDELYISKTSHMRKHGVKYRLVISDGNSRYVSQWMHANQAEENYSRLAMSIEDPR